MSHKTRKDYQEFKKVITPKLESIRNEVGDGKLEPRIRSELITIITRMEGYKEHQNSSTKRALAELHEVLGIEGKPDRNVSFSFSAVVGTVTAEMIPVRSRPKASALSDALSKLIGGLNQPDHSLLD